MFQYHIENLLFRFFFYALNLFPLSLGYIFAYVLAEINIKIVKIRIKTLKNQLRESFPQKSEKKIKKLTRQINLNLAKNAVEFCWFSRKRLADKEKYIQFKDYKNIETALENGKGLILFMGHFGNWELAGQTIALKTDRVCAVVKGQKNLLFDDFISQMRKFNKIEIIPKKFALRGILNALKQNKIILILGDQNAGKSGILTKFFKRDALTNPGTAKIALKFGCPIIFATCLRQADKKYLFEFSKPFFLQNSQSIDKDVKKYTQILTTMLEEKIRKSPEQWFWLHRRWKGATKLKQQKKTDQSE